MNKYLEKIAETYDDLQDKDYVRYREIYKQHANKNAKTKVIGSLVVGTGAGALTGKKLGGTKGALIGGYVGGSLGVIGAATHIKNKANKAAIKDYFNK